MHRKAQGLPLEVIVIASLCVIVLVVLILIFTGHTGNFQRQVSECETRGGKCLPQSQCSGAVIGADCGAVTSDVTNGIDYATLGGNTVCCISLK